MTIKDVALMPQNLSKIEFDPDDQWEVVVNKDSFILTGKEAEMLKKANEMGYTGIVWFPKFAISIGLPILLAGTIFANSSNCFLSPIVVLVPGVSIAPGAIALTFMLYSANSKAADLVKPSIPAFDAE